MNPLRSKFLRNMYWSGLQWFNSDDGACSACGCTLKAGDPVVVELMEGRLDVSVPDHKTTAHLCVPCGEARSKELTIDIQTRNPAVESRTSP